MRAERDDAPLKPRNQSSNLKWVIALGIGTSITIGMLFVANMNAGKTKLKNAFAIVTNNPSKVEKQKAIKNEEIDWDKIVEDQARRDAEKNSRKTIQTIENETEKQRIQAEQERRSKAAIATINARKFGEGVREEPKEGKQKQTIIIVGKESRISDYCPGGEGSIMRRNCKQRTNLETRF